MKEHAIRILCADDDEETLDLYRAAIELEADLECVGVCTRPAQILAALDELHPQVLVMDLRMPGWDALAKLPELRTRYPETAILVASGYDDPAMIERLFERGASGFHLKSSQFHELAIAIRRVANGERVNGASRFP
jgi:two-component system response regulator DesR